MDERPDDPAGRPPSPQEVEDFLVGYQESLENLDPQAAARHWGEPGAMVTDEFVGVLERREEMAEGLAQSYPLYEALGLVRVEHTLLERVDLTDRLVRLRVRWHFYGEDEHLTDSDYEYVLRNGPDGLLAHVAIGIDDTAKLRELAARKGVDLEAFGDSASR